jgi:hypothetical protein
LVAFAGEIHDRENGVKDRSLGEDICIVHRSKGHSFLRSTASQAEIALQIRQRPRCSPEDDLLDRLDLDLDLDLFIGRDGIAKLLAESLGETKRGGWSTFIVG